MKTSDILLRAAEVMIERGHGKGFLEDPDGRVCLYGACFMAAQQLGKTFPKFQEFTPYLDGVIDSDVVRWNDREETTEAMALGALHEAALLAKEQGD